jgi:hypothetical protein
MSADPTRKHGDRKPPEARVAIPSGTPAWITAELLAMTIRVWQPYYAERLSPQDAVTIVQSVGRLFGILSRE